MFPPRNARSIPRPLIAAAKVTYEQGYRRVRGREKGDKIKETIGVQRHATGGPRRGDKINRRRRIARNESGRVAVVRQPSIRVDHDTWTQLDRRTLDELEARTVAPPAGEDYAWVGSLKQYAQRRFSSLQPALGRVVLPHAHVSSYLKQSSVEARDDPIMRRAVEAREQAEEDFGAGKIKAADFKKHPTVFASEAAMSAIMAARHSFIPWDVVFTCYKDLIFIERRDPHAARVPTVCESASKPPAEDAAIPGNQTELGLESLLVESLFQQQSLYGDKQQKIKTAKVPAGSSSGAATGGAASSGSSSSSASGSATATKIKGLAGPPVEKDPFAPAVPPQAPATHTSFRYRVFDLGADDDGQPIRVLSRGRVHAVHCKDPKKAAVKPVNLHALLDWERPGRGKVERHNDWRKTTEPAQLMLSMLGENKAQVGRWLANAMLGGVEELRLAVALRTNKGSTVGHEVRFCQSTSVEQVAKDVLISREQMWGMVQWAVAAIRTYVRLARAAAGVEHEALDSNVYSFVLMRHPNEPTVTIYRTDGTTGGELFGGADDAAFLEEDIPEEDEGEDGDGEDDALAGLDDLLDDDM